MAATLALGCMNFGTRTDEAVSRRIIDYAIERGVTVIDTANVYGDGASERIVGEAIANRRGSITLATKCGLLRRNGRPEGLSPPTIRQAIEASLKRLGTDYIDIYYLHAPDPTVPIEQSLHAMGDLVERGLVRKLGLSNFAAWQILEIDLLATVQNLARPAISQQLYNLVVRQLDIEYFKFTARHAVHTTVYNPLAGGLLAHDSTMDDTRSSAARYEQNPLYRRRYGSLAMRDAADAYRKLAHEEGMTLIELAYAWLAGRTGVDSILVGPATVAHLDAAIDATKKTLSPKTRTRIDEVHVELTGTDASYAR